MEHFELLQYVAAVLNRLNVPYFVTGSVATAHFGEPRFTNDIDIVADLPLAAATELCAAFPIENFYISEDAVRSAIRGRGQFNIIHPASGLKVDIILPKRDPLDESRLARRRLVELAPNLPVWFSAPEDVILKKLEFYQDGGSEKHLRDIASVVKIMGTAIDETYISHWAARLGLEKIWNAILVKLKES